MWKPGIVVFRKFQSNAFVKLQTILKNHYYKRNECLESYESITLKLGEDICICSEAYGRRLCLVKMDLLCNFSNKSILNFWTFAFGYTIIKMNFSIVIGICISSEARRKWLRMNFQPIFDICNRSEARRTHLWNMEYSNTWEM